MPTESLRPLAGSHIVHRSGAQRLHVVAPEQRIQATIVLHPADDAAHNAAHVAHPAASAGLGAVDLPRRYDPGDDAINRVTAFAARYDLEVIETSRARHDVVVEGTPAQLRRAFGVTLHHFEHAGGRYYAHEDEIHLPDELIGIVDGVLGLDNVPLHTPHLTAALGATTFTTAQLAERYRFPAHDAAGASIALLQFGGGYDEQDLDAFARRYGVTLPDVRAISIVAADGSVAHNQPLARARMVQVAKAWHGATSFAAFAQQAGKDMSDFMATMEVTMDIELAAALGGAADIDVYFAPQGADGWRRAIYTALGERYPGSPAHAARLPAAISISWGECESAFGPAKLRLIHNALNAAALKGVPVCCSSGDRGSSNSFTRVDSANVNFPSSSPAVIAVGGTRITGDGEVAWKGELLGAPMASGGGMSGFFDRPAWQQGAEFAPVDGTWLADGRSKASVGRWLPDVAANAAFESGVEIVVGGEPVVGGGTSAAAPVWAALLTRMSAALGHPVAGLQPWLYQHGDRHGCIPVVGGDNDVSGGSIRSYKASGNWNACTGLGRPDGVTLLQALADTAPRRSPAARPRAAAPDVERRA